MKTGGWRLAVLLVAAPVLLSGCSLDVESFLRPPKAQGEQQAVQTALDTYIHDTGGKGQLYTLKYPSEGEYTSAFVLCDEGGFPVAQDSRMAAMAVAFYALDSNREETHVNLLRRDDDEWVSVGDSVGYGPDIRQVHFGDLDGDGMAELLTGWSTYNSQQYRLGVFSTTDELLALSTDRVYTGLFVGGLTADERDSLLLLHIGGGRQVTATLEQMKNNRLIPVDTVQLDGYIQQFGDMIDEDFGEAKGVYIEAVKSAGTTITELVVVENGSLTAPWYDPAANQTTVTARPIGLRARDVDGDGQVEVPTCTLLPGYDDGEIENTTAWLTEWRAYDYITGQWHDRLHTVVNATDGYLVTLEEARRQTVTTAYDPIARTLDLLDSTTNRVWLRLTVGEDGLSGLDGGETMLVAKATDNQAAITAWYDPAVLDEEKVRYMLIRL